MTALDGTEAYRVASFVEKPDADTAARYIAAGDYLWNSGIFMMKVEIWLEELERYRLDIAAACRNAYQSGRADGDFSGSTATHFTPVLRTPSTMR